jgi:hypothetical protein
VLVGLAIGAGEIVIWPRIAAQYGASMIWAAAVGAVAIGRAGRSAAGDSYRTRAASRLWNIAQPRAAACFGSSGHQ